MMKIVLLVALVALASIQARPRSLRLDGRIVGGQPTNILKYPYQISLQLKGDHICGGSIIDSTHILTAAHCLFDILLADLSIRAGSTVYDEGGQLISVNSIVVHPQYNPDTVDYDIAMLKLSNPLKFDFMVRPIPLIPAGSSVADDKFCLCAGWGAFHEGGSPLIALQEIDLQILNHSRCQDLYADFNEVTDRMICTHAGNKDACTGDSGSPLAYNGVQIGIVSWGRGCAQKNSPGVFTNIAVMHDFINEAIKQ